MSIIFPTTESSKNVPDNACRNNIVIESGIHSDYSVEYLIHKNSDKVLEMQEWPPEIIRTSSPTPSRLAG